MTEPLLGVRTLVDSLDGQLATQHTAVTMLLAEIITLLGGAPPTPTATLADLLEELQALRSNMNTNDAAQLLKLDMIYDLLADFIAPMLENIFFGINDLVSLQSANPDAPKLPPPLTTVDLPSEELQEHCRRVQWMIDYFFDSWMAQIADIAVGGSITGLGILLGAIAVTGIGAMPAILIAGGATAAAAAWQLGLAGIETEATEPHRATLRSALYGADNASQAQAAWNAAIDSMTPVEAPYRQCWKSLIWATWFNDLYNQSGKNSTVEPGTWETDSYSGTLCASEAEYPAGQNYTSELITITGYGSRQAIAWPNGTNIDPNGGQYSAAQFLPGDQTGATITYVEGSFRIVHFYSGGYSVFNGGAGIGPKVFGAGQATVGLYIDDFNVGDGSTFTINYIPPPD